MAIFENWKIGTRLALGFGLVAAMFLVNIAMGLTLLKAVDNNAMRVVNQHLPNALRADQMGDAILRIQQVFTSIANQHKPDSGAEAEIDRLAKEFSGNAAHFLSLFRKEGNTEYQQVMLEIEDGFRKFLDESRGTLTVFHQQGMDKGHEASAKADAIRKTLEEGLDTLRTQQTGLAQSAAAEADGLVDLTRKVMLGSGVLALAVCLLVALSIRKRISLPLRHIARIASRIAEGETSLRVGMAGLDEVGELARALDHLLERIGESLALNRAVLNAVPDPIFMTDGEDVILVANDAATRLAGVSGERLVGRACTQAIKPGVCGTLLRPARQSGQDIGVIECHTASGHAFFQPRAVTVKDEQGKTLGFLEVARDVSEMVLKEREIAKHLECLVRVNGEVDQAASLIAEATDSIASQMEQVSAGATAQSERVSETVISMNQIGSSVGEVADNASKASRLAEDAKGKAREGALVVSNSVEAIGKVQELSGSLKQSLSLLGDQAEAIGRIMGVISDIADQTNLLALNAAIEAARAGEAGRGFAVVADEVRKLAEKTMTATKEVGQAVERIQSGVGESILGMDEASSAIQHATSLATLSGQALEGIVPLVEETSRQVELIARAAEEQTSASAAINEHIRDVNEVSRETAVGVERSKQATADLAAMAHRLKELAGSGV
ncbi:methyl-accepting chemotaxis sensory transducer with Pas/Pac sensor (plasmid) [Solidesulfovibrio carbinoliphilus subsp. oakridgensis]|jgi:methyl-accepting chemotaxis protein|uniref:Methyl-accepting chemotaxis sensory transducer with Pas/Pac sensor n=3 Tax=Solidesulfovibrio TaxID=2910984 RepID=G7QEE2_9BACT|nr:MULTISPECIES: methyl-accepting chemotaxis protein [Desulfovibrionaceae]EHJ45938.1 methyl-accepting chemotaxis sensory transducer with Pas/Pac sensor [Solidesulfovibrio carbinoliphilus subsp. oakridgensis]KHK00277.1 Methyl-accepting chemotaxis protein [Desulfovibrio sp. TomC]HML53224.1 methyl-accepting chemotaxis protein [Solidesulfovibrio magneticus]